MSYIYGFVAAIPAANKDVYEKHVRDSLSMFKDYGVARLVETWDDDVPDGQVTDFRRAVQANDDEIVGFAWQEYPDRATAEAADAKMQDDPAMANMGQTMPFDATRMIWGGFDPIYEDGEGGGKPGYVDGSLIPVKSARKEDYRALLQRQAPLFRELGALRFVDAWGDNVPDGTKTDFKKAVQAEDDETVVFSFIEWPSKQVRDAAWPKVYEDPRMRDDNSPADEGRRVFGGFVPLVDA